MKIEKNACNQCGKETVDVYAEKGWIRFNSLGTNGIDISVTKGRRDDGNAITDYKSFGASHMPLEFCSYECLKKFIQELGKKK